MSIVWDLSRDDLLLLAEHDYIEDVLVYWCRDSNHHGLKSVQYWWAISPIGYVAIKRDLSDVDEFSPYFTT